MTPEQPSVLEFPAWLYGTTAAIRRKVRAEGRWWAREYLKTGAFPQPRQMRQVQPGEVLVMHSAAEFDLGRTRWWMHMFGDVFMDLNGDVPKEERQRMRDAFESFCLGTPWGALEYTVSPSPPRSAERVANRLASVLRFWDVLQGPRYAFWPGRKYTLEEHLKHHEVLSDPDFLHERLSALPLEKFEDFSSADKYAVAVQLAAWDRELGQH
jgi:hypothetical protein